MRGENFMWDLVRDAQATRKDLVEAAEIEDEPASEDLEEFLD